ncbi:uncharacterized protein M437DRAFT_66483 [Aureobasidium melanogenum CBS 110374]|uniref:Cora-domain-containing protein n=1 Tax=Aureobasidium melanogenum (strain CBS 110374) TaxID=1043003 RepID=A0A074VQA5_AURM1|nr:uncharacterized protein M437DRAFT_66483 [Aureobasidium melanogenum CBS 110374]KEQ62628.1 hypothetical protein M437DRAFT_66483 [Aureobasidium melanogenum CBS 110374]
MSIADHNTHSQDSFLSSRVDKVIKIQKARTPPRTKTLASYHTVSEHKELDLAGLFKVTDLSCSDGVVVVIENIDQFWIDRLVSDLGIDNSFFARHACNPLVTSTIWHAIFGNTVAEQKKPSEGSSDSHSYWHVDGIRKRNRYSPPSAEILFDTNHFPRILKRYDGYGWQANTRVSYYVRHDSPRPLCLLLIDGPLARSSTAPGEDQAAMTLHLPLAENRGGLVIPDLYEDNTHSLNRSLKRFLSHAWHFEVIFAPGKCLSPKTFFHLLVSSLFEENLRFLDIKIKGIAFNEIRRPNILINDRLHDLRQALVSLQDQVDMTRKWLPPSVQQDLESIQRTLEDTARSNGSEIHQFVGFPSKALPEIFQRCTHLEGFLMQSFQLLVSSTSVMNAEVERERSNRNQALTQLAFLYVPLSFVTGVFGMNIKEINGSPLSVWVVIVTLILTVVCTAAIFVIVRVWKKYSDEHKDESSQGFR